MGWNSAPIQKPEILERRKKRTSNLCKLTLDVYPIPWKQRFNLPSFYLTIFPDVSCSLTDVSFTRKLCSWEWECYGHGCYRQWVCEGKVWNKTLHEFLLESVVLFPMLWDGRHSLAGLTPSYSMARCWQTAGIPNQWSWGGSWGIPGNPWAAGLGVVGCPEAGLCRAGLV